MAEIYLAKTRGVAGFEKYLALKVIHPNFADDEQFVGMLIDEAKIAVNLNHVNIGQIFDLGRWEKTYYIAMEFIDGFDLFKIMRQLSTLEVEVPIDVATYIVQELCTGLDYAHRKHDTAGRHQNIIHRDISPQNVIISKAGEVKIVDFGIAKAASRSRATQAGVIKGKYFYMSPEQAWGDEIDQRSDIFSAGIILYEVLTGQMLYLQEDLHQLLDMVRKAEIPKPSILRPDIPPKLETIVMKALAKRPADRWQKAHDFRVALTEFLYSYTSDFTPERVTQLVYTHMTKPVEAAPKASVSEVKLLAREEVPADQKSVIFDISELDGVELLEEGKADAGESTRISPPPRGMFLSPEPGFEGDVVDAATPDERTLVDRAPSAIFTPKNDPAHNAEVVIKPPKPWANSHPPVRRVYRPTGPVLPAVKLKKPGAKLEVPTVIGLTSEWEPMPVGSPAPGSAPLPSGEEWQNNTITKPNPTPLPAVATPAVATPAVATPPPPPLLPPTAQQTWGAWPTPQPPPGQQPTQQQLSAGQLSQGQLWPQNSPEQRVEQVPPWLTPPPSPVQTDEETTLPRGKGRWVGWMLAVSIVGLVGISAAIGISIYSPFSRETPTIIVESVPEGAQVLINGAPAKKKTPVAIKLQQLGNYKVHVALRNYEPFEQIARLSEEERRVKVLAVLTPKTGSIEVVSVPSGADIYINNELRGTTPHNLNNLNLDEDISFELRKRGYKSVIRSMKWEERTFRKVKVHLERAR
ncbi:MAG: serine/threonine protein kinase [Deltaproteobacteria bacterium]|nr:serine/threonine protein kinase [Deltaproteobacteria bacterium]